MSKHVSCEGVTRTVQWACTVWTVRVCVTVLTEHGALTSTVGVCVSRGLRVHAAITGCVLMGPTACTANTTASATHKTLSGVLCASMSVTDDH